MLADDLARRLNALGLLAITAVLGFAFADQFIKHDLPCPLCLIQRMGFVACGVAIAMNVTLGHRPQHYGIAILSALLGALASARQVMLHIAPGTGSYGDAFLGLHFYSWAFIVFVAIITGSAFMLLVARFERDTARLDGLAKIALGAFFAIVAGNAVSTLLECGGGLCPDDPVRYEFLDTMLKALRR